MKSDLMLRADAAYQNGDFEFALSLYFDYLVANETTAELFMKIGHCNKMLGDDDNAIEYYEKALELDSENYEVLFNFAEALMYVGRYNDGLDAISTLINLTANTGMEIYEVARSKKMQIMSQKHNYLGGVCMKEQRYDEAMQEFLAAIELFPSDKRNYANIGVIHLKTGNPEGAIEWFRKAIEVDEYYVRGYYNLGTILMQKALWGQAIQIFTKALEIEPDGRDSADIEKNMEHAQQNISIPQTELVNILSGKMPRIDSAYALELLNSVFTENVLSVDFVITENSNYKLIAYCTGNTYEFFVNNNELEFKAIG